jgi:hypothetical protein
LVHIDEPSFVDPAVGGLSLVLSSKAIPQSGQSSKRDLYQERTATEFVREGGS